MSCWELVPWLYRSSFMFDMYSFILIWICLNHKETTIDLMWGLTLVCLPFWVFEAVKLVLTWIGA